MADADALSSPLKTFMKWVGIIAAVLSLIAGLRQFLTMTADSAERERRIGELLATAAAQQSAKDYLPAWTSLEAAVTQAEQGNLLARATRRLGESRQRVRLAQEDLAMRWLQNISVPHGQPFGSVVDRVLPVLHRGAVDASGPRLGDLYAHVGWGYFLKRRDGQSALDPAPWYAKALEADPGNPYARAFSGHWKTWNNEPLDAAMADFAAALAGRRERPFVRGMQVSALLNRSNVEARLEVVKVAGDMRKNGEPIDERVRREIRLLYRASLSDRALTERLDAALPAGEQVALLDLVEAGSGPGAGSDDALRAARARLERPAKP